MIANQDSPGGSKASRQLEARRQKTLAQSLPELPMTHSEFATVRQVGSNEEIADLVTAGHERLKMKGDCGSWFICYPKTKTVYLVKFIRDRSRTKPGK
jgi:hypothetical protein